MAGLALFLQRSRLGVAIRGSADRADRAALLGVPVKRLQMLVWGVAGVLAFAATFLRAGMLGLPLGAGLSLGLLLRSLTALLLGSLPRLPVLAARKSVVWGKSVSVRVDHVGRRIIKKKNHTANQ